MSGLKEIRTRIHSVGAIMQITAAMRMVSAAKLKKAQDDIGKMRPYADKLRELLQQLTATTDSEHSSPYAQARPVSRVLIVAITANRGLCGAFNSNVIKTTRRRIATAYPDKDVSLLSIGKKGYGILKKSHEVIADEHQLYEELSFRRVERVATDIMRSFAQGHYDKVELVYNKFKNAINQELITEQLLPIALPEGKPSKVDYLYEPDRASLLEALIPKALKNQLFKALLDSIAAEHAARMTAMYKATDNAEDLQMQLRRTYNKARQATITREISEIVGGAEALSN